MAQPDTAAAAGTSHEAVGSVTGGWVDGEDGSLVEWRLSVADVTQRRAKLPQVGQLLLPLFKLAQLDRVVDLGQLRAARLLGASGVPCRVRPGLLLHGQGAASHCSEPDDIIHLQV